MTTNLSYLPVNEDNLVYQSAKRLMDEFHLEGGLDIKLDKRIPVAAGMAVPMPHRVCLPSMTYMDWDLANDT